MRRVCRRVGCEQRQVECDCKEYNRELTKQFINRLDDEAMISEILRKLSALEDIDDATSEPVLLCAQRVHAQRAQKEALNNIKEAKEFDSVKYSTQKHDKVKYVSDP